MDFYNKEKYILNTIKYAPIIIVLILSFLITQFILHQKYNSYYKDIRFIEKTYLEKNKHRIKEEVDRVLKYINDIKFHSEQKLMDTIKQRVYEAHEIATNIYKQEMKLSDSNDSTMKEHAFLTIKNSLGSIRYNQGRGYIFMDDINGIKLLQPIRKEFEGRDFTNFEDAKGYKFIEKIIQTIKDKTENYDSYYWYKNDNYKDSYKKISFYKYFEPMNAVIGTGEYIDDFNNELKKQVLSHIQNIFYGENGYIFVYNAKGIVLSTFDKNLIGKNLMDFQNQENEYIVKNTLNFAKKNSEGGYYKYLSSNSPKERLKNTRKISYVVYYEPWNWMIGSGFYLDALKAEIEKRKELLEETTHKAIENITYISIIITIIFILISSFISNEVAKKFIEYKKSLKEEIKQKLEKEKLLVQQSKMATMGEMLNNIAHQWKQPLSVIITSNSLIKFQREYGGSFNETQIDKATDSIEKAVNNLSDTIDDFKSFFNPNKISEFFYINDAFEKTFKLINTHLKTHEIEIIKDIQVIKMKSYQNEILQVLINILKNAKDQLIKNNALDEKIIVIKVRRIGENVNITIKDNAGGIPEELLSKLFTSYLTTKVDDGAGIGLYMSKQIINSLNGTIVAKNTKFIHNSEQYKGAEFIITIPVKSS